MRWALVAAILLAGCFGPGPAEMDEGAAADGPALRFLPAVQLPCPDDALAQLQEEVVATCGGFGEPVLEVRGDGQVWVAGNNGASRLQRDLVGDVADHRELPIWTSGDGGVSFTQRTVEGPEAQRALLGTEGDLAVDAGGGVYFLAMTGTAGGHGAYLSRFEADGAFAYSSWVHLPNYEPGIGPVEQVPFPPVVDRPWVRAGDGPTVHAVYNLGHGTNLATSVDGGRTFDPLTVHQFPCPLMVPGQGPARDTLYLAGCPDDPRLWVSRDGAGTWNAPLDLPMPWPNGAALVDDYVVPVADDAGNVYVTFTHALDAANRTKGVFVDVLTPQGVWHGPFLVSKAMGWSEKPWPAAGAAGRAAVAWYWTEGAIGQPQDALWHLEAAALTWDGKALQIVAAVADPDPVLAGDFGRELGDFLQADIGPDGRLHVAYARRMANESLEVRVVVSDGWEFGAGVPANGPPA